MARVAPVFERADFDAFVAQIRRGRPIRFACALAGIAPLTWRYWRRKGAKNARAAARGKVDLDEYGLVWWEYQRARAAWAADRLDAIQGSPKWEAQAWLLKTRFPGDFLEPEAKPAKADETASKRRGKGLDETAAREIEERIMGVRRE